MPLSEMCQKKEINYCRQRSISHSLQRIRKQWRLLTFFTFSTASLLPSTYCWLDTYMIQDVVISSQAVHFMCQWLLQASQKSSVAELTALLKAFMVHVLLSWLLDCMVPPPLRCSHTVGLKKRAYLDFTILAPPHSGRRREVCTACPSNVRTLSQCSSLAVRLPPQRECLTKIINNILNVNPGLVEDGRATHAALVATGMAQKHDPRVLCTYRTLLAATWFLSNGTISSTCLTTQPLR